MRNFLSVFSLFIKRSFGKIFALLLAFTAAEGVLFIHNLNSDNVIKNEFQEGTGNNYLLGIENILGDHKLLLVVLASGFILITLILCLIGCEFSDKQGYTLRRLNISEKKIFICQSLYGTAVYGIFFMIQALIFYVFCFMYVNFATGNEYSFEGLISNQTVFLAFYRSEILHALMPLDDILKHISNLTMITAMGVSTASFSYFMRRKKFPFEAILLVPVILINFASDWTEMTYELVIMGMSIFVIGSIITRISLEGQAYDR